MSSSAGKAPPPPPPHLDGKPKPKPGAKVPPPPPPPPPPPHHKHHKAGGASERESTESAREEPEMGPFSFDRFQWSALGSMCPGGPPREYSDEERRVLDAALEHVKTLGWSQEALTRGATDVELSPAAHGLFPRGPVELVEFFVQKSNEQMLEKMRSNEDILRDMRAKDKVKTAVRVRLQAIVPYKHNWSEAMALGALPQNAPRTMESIARLMDSIWHLAGDRSTDFNWYTKRALLGGVYTATEVYLLTDQSPDQSATWDFLDRRIDDVTNLATLPHQVQHTVETGIAFLTRLFNSSSPPHREEPRHKPPPPPPPPPPHPKKP